MLIGKNWHKEGGSIKTRSPPASLSFKDQAVKRTTVKMVYLPSYAKLAHTDMILSFFVSIFCGNMILNLIKGS